MVNRKHTVAYFKAVNLIEENSHNLNQDMPSPTGVRTDASTIPNVAIFIQKMYKQ
jgi:hypothetical protein